jgi:hypothetical protein
VKKTFIVLFLLIVYQSFSQKLKIVEKPIVWDSTRIALSIEYLKQRHGIEQTQPTIQPKMVVVHWTAIPTFDKSFLAFNSSALPNARKELQNASQLNVSAHYLIDRDGTDPNYQTVKFDPGDEFMNKLRQKFKKLRKDL